MSYRNQPLLLYLYLYLLLLLLFIPNVISLVLDPYQNPHKRRTVSSRGKEQEASSSSSSSSSSYNKNNKNKNWAAIRQSGVKIRRNSKTSKPPPQWEKEGDELYHYVVSSDRLDSNHHDTTNKADPMTVLQAQELLVQLELSSSSSPSSSLVVSNIPSDANEQESDFKTVNTSTTKELDKTTRTNSPFLWGDIPVGPVMKSKLMEAGFTYPTWIQSAAFVPISRRTSSSSSSSSTTITARPNVILASPTGTGKSLAYLIPLMASRTESSKKSSSPSPPSSSSSSKIIIVTPTHALAIQLQRQVNQIWPPTDSLSSFLHVLEYPSPGSHAEQLKGEQENEYKNDGEENSQFSFLSKIPNECVFIAGTPRKVYQLIQELNLALSSSSSSSLSSYQSMNEIIRNRSVRKKAESLRNHLRAIVLDEADQLLHIEQLVTTRVPPPMTKAGTDKKTNSKDEVDIRKREQHRQHLGKPSQSSSNASRVSYPQPSLTSRLLQELPKSILNNVQLIGVSATVGRTLRRQFMDLLQAPSLDKAAMVITDPVRIKKDGDRRKISLLPSTLVHRYHLWEDPTSIGSTSASTSTNLSSLEVHTKSVAQSLWKMMQTWLSPAPMLIFPGNIDVIKLAQALAKQGNLEHVHSCLSSKDLIQNTGIPSPNSDSNRSWTSTPILVVSDKLGRGLDVPNIQYVILCAPPLNSAGYTHLAGRTGRNGCFGTAITLVQPQEARNLVEIARTLGVSMLPIGKEAVAASSSSPSS